MEDSITSGRIKVVCVPEALALIGRQVSAFRALYPKAEIEVGAGWSREAMGALFAASCDVAVIARELEPEERRAAVQGNLGFEGYRFARDAVVIIVHPTNPVENVAIDDLRRIYRGVARRWSDVGGTYGETVTPVVQTLQSDLSEFFQQQVMGDEPMRAAVIYEDSDSAVVARVIQDPTAIGYVSLGGLTEEVKTLRLASLTGLPYWKPDREAVYKGDYPLTRFYNMYCRTGAARLANGFITFVTSIDGQRVVRDSDLVPTAVRVRFVRRSPMLSSHPEEERN